ncbi:hypothetical protein FBEOM_6684 [Fusarium beomiforme]|uniref:Uncharacterized protein n=1 Tax=Fusarium beomiforme TaxID=44412 RepID=A0A9P5AIU7_9HYPO|nr:hypothetical protein FBEOM_6684 [Fusarium beomiforme]
MCGDNTQPHLPRIPQIASILNGNGCANTPGSVRSFLARDDSHLLVIFTVVAGLVFLATIALFVFVFLGTRKAKRNISSEEDDDKSEPLYKVYRNTQIYNFLNILVLFACIGMFLYLVANITMLSVAKCLLACLAYLFGVLIAAVLFQIWNVWSLKKNLPPVFSSDESGDEEEGTELDDVSSEA